jgi:predicted ribonuclease YlaK
MAIAAAMEQVLRNSKKYKKIIISRPVQPLGKDIGFLARNNGRKDASMAKANSRQSYKWLWAR